MGWGIFKKIKKAIQDAGRFVKDKIIKPVLKPENIKKAIDLGTKLAPLLGGAVSVDIYGDKWVFTSSDPLIPI